MPGGGSRSGDSGRSGNWLYLAMTASYLWNASYLCLSVDLHGGSMGNSSEETVGILPGCLNVFFLARCVPQSTWVFL